MGSVHPIPPPRLPSAHSHPRLPLFHRFSHPYPILPTDPSSRTPSSLPQRLVLAIHSLVSIPGRALSSSQSVAYCRSRF
ncbi:hypothetical protein DL98DRAFT_281549 [Cadophora sp. DSE1049]|nr:hypothetical protein DL98DRAFT_281549 [Cadophora sp. DSE1049]